MKKIKLVFAFVFIIAATTYAQLNVEGVQFSKQKTIETEELVLNGAGLREKLWFDLYAIGLYIKEKQTNANQIVKADESMLIHLEILSGLLSKKKMIAAFKSGFEKSNTNDVVVKLQPKINKFVAFLKDEINVGDKYSVIYLKGKGTTDLVRNDVLLGSIEGVDFKQALFNIWLSDDCVDKDVKRSLLNSN